MIFPVLILPATQSFAQRILTSSSISIESVEYKFPGNSHGCGQIVTNLTELVIDMSENSCGGGSIQCPRCFVLHNPIKLSIKECQSPPRSSRCQETGVCPTQNEEDINNRLNEYVFINMSEGVVFAGSDATSFSSIHTSGESDSVAIRPNSAKSGVCYQGRFFWL
jgi:hypothetical protein